MKKKNLKTLFNEIEKLQKTLEKARNLKADDFVATAKGCYLKVFSYRDECRIRVHSDTYDLHSLAIHIYYCGKIEFEMYKGREFLYPWTITKDDSNTPKEIENKLIPILRQVRQISEQHLEKHTESMSKEIAKTFDKWLSTTKNVEKC